jgi:hypothetical protein
LFFLFHRMIGKTTTQPNIMLTVIRYQQSLTIFFFSEQKSNPII